MKVFLSWSGAKSKAVAEALRDWLPRVIQEVQPFMSSKDIAAGDRWLNEITQELDGTSFGIVCVTQDNQSSSWLNFEAGAIGKEVGKSGVVPLAIDLSESDVKQPLAQFQAKTFDQAGMLDILNALNARCEKPVKDIEAACDVWWPHLEPHLETASAPSEEAVVRTDREILEEILISVRGLQDRPSVDPRTDNLNRMAAAIAAKQKTDVMSSRSLAPFLQAAAERAAQEAVDQLNGERVLALRVESLVPDAKVFMTQQADGSRVAVIQTDSEIPPSAARPVEDVYLDAGYTVQFVFGS